MNLIEKNGIYYYTLPIISKNNEYYIEDYEGKIINIQTFAKNNYELIHYIIAKDIETGDTLKFQDRKIYYTRTTKTKSLRGHLSNFKFYNLLNSERFIIIDITVKPEFKTAKELIELLKNDNNITEYKLMKNKLILYTFEDESYNEVLYKQYIIEPTGELTEI